MSKLKVVCQQKKLQWYAGPLSVLAIDRDYRVWREEIS